MPTKNKQPKSDGRNTVQFPDDEYEPIRKLAVEKGVKGPGLYVRNVLRRHVQRTQVTGQL